MEPADNRRLSGKQRAALSSEAVRIRITENNIQRGHFCVPLIEEGVETKLFSQRIFTQCENRWGPTVSGALQSPHGRGDTGPFVIL